jgi:hypothetical protein
MRVGWRSGRVRPWLVRAREYWVQRRAHIDARTPPWQWAVPEMDTRTLPELAALLARQDHPAHLVIEETEARKLAHVHVWNERTQQFMRACHLQFLDALTLTGIQQFGPQWNTVIVLSPADATIVGHRDTLFQWLTQQLAKEPAYFFPAVAPQAILDLCASHPCAPGNHQLM